MSLLETKILAPKVLRDTQATGMPRHDGSVLGS